MTRSPTPETPVTRQVIVSIHDVTQHNSARVSKMLEALRGIGIPRCSLLVVPNYHRRGPMKDDVSFCSWMQEARRDGHEIVAHGFYHLRDSRPRESLSDRWVTRFYTRGEGEFYDMSEFEAEHRIKMVLASFRSTAIPVRGFIAPAWLLSAGAQRALARLGFEYTTLVGAIVDLTYKRHIAARSLVYSTSAAWRRAASLVWNQILFSRQKARSLVRIGIHPPDFEHPAIWRQILRFARSLSRTHLATTYADWITHARNVYSEETAVAG